MSLSEKGRRDKGIRGEREVLTILKEAKYDVRGLEGQGDHLAMKRRRRPAPGTLVLHIEVKRQETLQPDAWHRQAMDEAPDGAIPLVAYRRSAQPWRVTILLDDLIELLG